MNIAASAAIERELKLFLPLTSDRRSLLANTVSRQEISLHYFTADESLSLARRVLGAAGRIVADGAVFSVADFARGVVRAHGGARTPRYFLDLMEFRPRGGTTSVHHHAIHIPRDAAKRLGRAGHDTLRRLEAVSDHFGPVLIDGRRHVPEDFTSARLRNVLNLDGERRFFLDFKGKRRDHHRMSRPELSIEVTKSDFFAFRQFSSGGSIEKTRYLHEGALRFADASTIPVTAELDLLRSAGSRVSRSRNRDLTIAESLEIPEFALVELELPRSISRNKVLRAIRSGNHSIEILSGVSLALSYRTKEEWSALGMRALARDGLTERVREQLIALHRRCRVQAERILQAA